MKIRKKIGLVIFIAFNLLTQSTFAQSSVWKVSKGGNYFYIAGTIETPLVNAYPLPKEFDLAYQKSDEIISEADYAIQSTQEAEIIAASSYTGNHTLTSELTPKNYRKFGVLLASYELPIDLFSKFKPWPIYTVVMTKEYDKISTAKKEVDVTSHFTSLARREGKKVSGMQTAKDSLDSIKLLGLFDSNDAVEYILRDIKRLPAYMKITNETLRNGDMDFLSNSPVVTQMKNDIPAIYYALTTDRINQWMALLPSLVKDKKVEFALIDTMNLGGEDGILNRLKRQGFIVSHL